MASDGNKVCRLVIVRVIAQPSPYQVVLGDAVQRVDGSRWGMEAVGKQAGLAVSLELPVGTTFSESTLLKVYSL